jgi:hypothetical protein
MVWQSPSEIVAQAFSSHDVVMINEGHNGFARCIRTRRVGLAVLPAAHEHGCRHLAVEALPNPTNGPKFSTVAPTSFGYFAHPEMIDFLQGALHLGWTLVAYEAATDLDKVRSSGTETIDDVNDRERRQATSLAEAKLVIGSGNKLLVWCGNGHHAKQSVQGWRPMGLRFTELSGVEPFCIDQLPTVALAPEHRPDIELTSELTMTLVEHGGTAGFCRTIPPPGYWVPPYYDALILSIDNDMTEAANF